MKFDTTKFNSRLIEAKLTQEIGEPLNPKYGHDTGKLEKIWQIRYFRRFQGSSQQKKTMNIRYDDHILEVMFWLIQLFEKNFVFILCFDKFY